MPPLPTRKRRCALALPRFTASTAAAFSVKQQRIARTAFRHWQSILFAAHGKSATHTAKAFCFAAARRLWQAAKRRLPGKHAGQRAATPAQREISRELMVKYPIYMSIVYDA
jgi:hypothetical protein